MTCQISWRLQNAHRSNRNLIVMLSFHYGAFSQWEGCSLQMTELFWMSIEIRQTPIEAISTNWFWRPRIRVSCGMHGMKIKCTPHLLGRKATCSGLHKNLKRFCKPCLTWNRKKKQSFNIVYWPSMVHKFAKKNIPACSNSLIHPRVVDLPHLPPSMIFNMWEQNRNHQKN